MEPYKHVVREDFSSLHQLLDVISKRPNGKCMQGADSSKTNSKTFTGTSSYDEATKMLANGYIEILGQLKDDVKSKSKISAKYAADVAHPIPHAAIVGYTPCVPNAILGLPNSMISVDRVPMKRKTLSIIYVTGANAGTEAEYFSTAGAALLSAINIIEKSGIQTQLKLAFFPSEEDDEVTFPTVTVKNYGERYSLQKISFPLAHPSMFRRIGFKWLETTPDITKKGYKIGYGRVPDITRLKESVVIDKNTYLVDIKEIHRNNCDVTEILKKLEVI